MPDEKPDQARIEALERQKSELERELGELRGDEPLTLERIRGMSPEQAGENWDQVKQFLAEDREPAAAEERPYGLERLRRVERNAELPR